MWQNKLKIAIVEKDADAIDKLMDTIPKFTDKKEIQSAMYLLKEASKLIYQLKDETSVVMAQLKKNMNFLNSTQTSINTGKLDIKS